MHKLCQLMFDAAVANCDIRQLWISLKNISSKRSTQMWANSIAKKLQWEIQEKRSEVLMEMFGVRA